MIGEDSEVYIRLNRNGPWDPRRMARAHVLRVKHSAKSIVFVRFYNKPQKGPRDRWVFLDDCRELSILELIAEAASD